MGSSQSSRKLTINNEDGVIQISTDLVQRLSVNRKKPTVSSQDGKSSIVSPELIVGQTSSNQSSVKNTKNQTSSNDGGLAHTYPDYTITAYKMQHQKELELQAQDQYWQKRLQNLKLSQEEITSIFQEEYTRAIDEVTNANGIKNINLNTMVPACGANREKVLRCYHQHPLETLKCSGLVEEFNDCVDQRRLGLISAEC